MFLDQVIGHQTCHHLLFGDSEVTSILRAEVLRLAGFRALAGGRFGWRVVYGAGAWDGAGDEVWAERA